MSPLSLASKQFKILDERYPSKERIILNKIDTTSDPAPLELSLEVMEDALEVAVQAFFDYEATSEYTKILRLLVDATEVEKKQYFKTLRILRRRLRGFMILGKAFSGAIHSSLHDFLRTLGILLDTPFLSKDIVSTLSKPDIVAEVHIYHKDILASLSIDYFKNWYKEQTKSITEFEAINPMSRLAFHSFRKKVRRIAILYKYLYLVTNEPVYEYYFGSLITEVDLLGKFHDDALQDDRQEIVLNYNFDIIKDLIRKLHN